MRGDGSARHIYRIKGGKYISVGIVGDNIAENRAFISFSRSFRNESLPVPEIYAVSNDERCYIEEDLGNTTFYDWMLQHRGEPDYDSKREAIYKRIITELLRFQVDASESIDYSLCYQTREFAEEQMRFDVNYFAEMFLGLVWKKSYDKSAFHTDCEKLISSLLAESRDYFLYRDFQSRNIMLKNDELFFIDYQSGRKGALQYDLASLLYDAKAQLSDELREKLLEHYLNELGTRVNVNREQFAASYHAFALLRVMQAMGAFANLGIRQKKAGFANSIPLAQNNLRSLLQQAKILDDLPSLKELFIDIASDTSLKQYADMN
jgi:aminoglycoside/choline kinase family phosphotransferase